jgi:hypothetical protein
MHDRPFRLRRLSAMLLLVGWVSFLASCLIGLWAIKNGWPAYASFDAATGAVLEQGRVALQLAPDAMSDFARTQWAIRISQGGGATLFFLGLASIMICDRRDDIRNWKPRSL